MDATEFFAASRILIVAGKGGVGKTTVCASIGLAAARSGLSVDIVELEGRSNLAAPFGIGELRSEPTEIGAGSSGPGSLRARRLTPDQALADYLVDHGLRIGGRLARFSAIELVTTTAPGIRDLLTLGRIRSLADRSDVDLIVVDAPAAGHATSFLEAPAGMADSAPSGPIRDQADAALAMLTDPGRCRVMLVTIPEETPVNELVDTAFALEDRVGVQLAPVVVNAVWPPIEGLVAAANETGKRASSARENRRDAAAFRLGKSANQEREIDRLAERLPLPQLHLPFRFVTELTEADIVAFAGDVHEQVAALDLTTPVVG